MTPMERMPAIHGQLVDRYGEDCARSSSNAATSNGSMAGSTCSSNCLASRPDDCGWRARRSIDFIQLDEGLQGFFVIAPVFFEKSFLAQCFRKQGQIACDPSGLDGLVVANQSVERTVGKLRAVGCWKVSYSKTCRVGGRRQPRWFAPIAAPPCATPAWRGRGEFVPETLGH